MRLFGRGRRPGDGGTGEGRAVGSDEAEPGEAEWLEPLRPGEAEPEAADKAEEVDGSEEADAAEAAEAVASDEADDAEPAEPEASDAAPELPPVRAGALWPVARDAEADTEAVETVDIAEPVDLPADAEPVVDQVAEADPDVTGEDAPAAPRRRFTLWSDEADADEDADEEAFGGRSPALRFAALHLRSGQHALARAELEALAGRGRLDEPALLDLAEIRWRTGDLAGAGDAAQALLARGSEEPLALVIAAEAVAAVGRPGEARRLSSRALEVADGPLDPLFAGMPRSSVWPASPEAEPGATPRRRGRNRAGDTSGAPSTASEAFAGGRAALARGDATRAALLLGVAMRLAPDFAEDVLRAVTGRDDQPLLSLVRGDALRLLGREAEALEAFDRARGRASASGATPAPSGPGLFDSDPALTDDDGA